MCLRTIIIVLLIVIASSLNIHHIKSYSPFSNYKLNLNDNKWRNKLISSLVFIFTTTTTIHPVSAEEVWTDRNRLVAETWRAVDDLFYDRTFNNIDWFNLRQEVVKKSYSSDEEVYSNLKTMLSKLGDKYTKYLSPAQYEALINSAAGELTGVGVQLLSNSEGNVIISAIEDDSPASGAGLQNGDVFINVDGTDAVGLSPEEVAAILRGTKGTKVSLRIKRNGQDIKDFQIVRQPFKLKGVSSTQLTVQDKNYAIIRIKSFSSTTADDITKILEKLHEDNKIDAIVLDMRNNGGGVLQAAVETSSLFLNSGKIVVFEVNKDGLSQAKQTLPIYIHSNDPLLPDLSTKLFVLVNEQTASAAEVLTAALKENGRAVVIGEKTYGKGVIQTLQELQKGGITVTIAKYETPLHNNINKIGIPVDIKLPCSDDSDIKACISKLADVLES